MADATCFSFHPRKIITTGEGGMITTNNEEIAAEIKSLKMFGSTHTTEGMPFPMIGTNRKLSDILAAIGVKQMERIKEIIDKRIELAKNYTRLLEKTGFVKPLARDEKQNMFTRAMQHT